MLQLLPNDDQLQVIDAISRFAADELPVSRFRAGEESRRELPRWREIAGLGYLTLALSEESGGAGFTQAEEVLVFRELGRALVSPVAIATTIAAHALASVRADELVTAICAGGLRAAPGIPSRSGGLIVLDGVGADMVVVREGQTITIHERRALQDVRESSSLDESIALEVARIASPPQFAVAAESNLARRLQLLVAAMHVGIGEQARDMAVGYAAERVQFGKPIGTFQAIKHRCADMALRSEMAFAQLLFATVAECDSATGAAFHSYSACLLAARSALENSAGSIQVHGGIGFTAEFDAHRYLKRARLLEHIGGRVPDQQTELLKQPFPV
jgi:alkylation response protein AidB-like acyl-CoA dehydrogenase